MVEFDNNVDGEVEKASVLVARKLQLTTVDAHTHIYQNVHPWHMLLETEEGGATIHII